MVLPFLGLAATQARGALPSPPPRTAIQPTTIRVLQPPRGGTTGFRRLPGSDTGVLFTNHLSTVAGTANRVLENGSGVAAGDVDGDGRTDLFFCGLSGNSTLYRNLGDWRFVNITGSVGLNLGQVPCRGAVFADLNGDGRADLLVSTLAQGVRCFLNQGGTFRDATAAAGTGGPPGSTTLTLADVDGNGTPDLYVTRYRADDIRDTSLVEARRVGGRTELHPKYQGRLVLGPTGLIEFGEPDLLYLNDGQAHFREVPWTGGAFLDEDGNRLETPPRDWGLTAAFRDLNGDGKPDLYVCNDYWTPDRLWLNTGGGRFRLAPRSTLRHTSENSMGVDFADIDRDGRTDFLVLDMLDPDPQVRRRQALAQVPMTWAPGEVDQQPQIMRNTLFQGRPDGSFAEIAEYAGLARSGWSWQPLFLDVDLDGWEDVLIPAGHRRDVQDLDATERIRALQHPWPGGMDSNARQEAFLRELFEHGQLYPPLDSPIHAFRNLGDARFAAVTTAWGLEESAVHQGSALADLDGDGDLDLVVNALNAEAEVFRNETSAPRISVRLRGAPPNTDAIGAVVRLTDAMDRPQERAITVGGRYLSGSDPLLTFAATPLSGPSQLSITWPNGQTALFPNPEPNHLYHFRETPGTSPIPPPRPAPAVLFEEIGATLGHRHTEDLADDLAQQPLLPRHTSRIGPGILIADLDGNDRLDLLITSGAGGTPGVFTNDTHGGFRPAPAWSAPTTVDQTAVASFRRGGSNGLQVLLGLAVPSSPAPAGPAVLPWVLPGAVASPPWPDATPTQGGPLAFDDVDGDGRPDLLVGGGAIPGRYPEAAPTRIHRWDGTSWRPDEPNTAVLRDAGLVHGAVWGDLDLDGDADLVLAVEWSPLRVYRNEGGRLVDATRAWGLEAWSGLWQGVTLGDLDGDGRLDILAGNWGLNSDLRASPDRPLTLVVGDLLNRGMVDLLEGEWDPVRGSLHPSRRLDELESALPTLRGLFPSHRAFTRATLEEVVRGFNQPVRRFEARTLASALFLNRPGGFEAHPLPPEAQYAPVSTVLVADFDGDGRQDAFLSQNNFTLRWQTPRLDAGQGLLLLGNGDGTLTPLDASQSGIHLEGDQRGAAFGDLDQDGRLDLVVGQNGGPTAVLMNRRGRPGLRVHLDAGPENPTGVGCVVWVEAAGDPHPGPIQPVLAGSGWGSCSSPVLVLARPEPGATLGVRWPGGGVTHTPIPDGATELRVSRKPSSKP